MLAVVLTVFSIGYWFTLLAILFAKMNQGERISRSFAIAACLVAFAWFIALPHSILEAVKERRRARDKPLS